MKPPDLQKILKECRYSTARSGGPGGQHVNKVNSKVVLKWNIERSGALTESQRALLLKILSKKTNAEGELVLSADGSKHQLQNREVVQLKLAHHLKKAFVKKKRRKPTKPTRTSVLKRLEQKSRHAEKKKRRRYL